MTIGLVSAELARLSERQNYLIAYSGGKDSHVLLHILTQLRQQSSTIHLRALHVHHGLSPDADDWAQHCKQVCQNYQVPFLLEKVTIPFGDSIEAAARQARYQVLANHLKQNECLLTAHTQDDQAETVLLQLVRGAGPKGLSAMPSSKPFAHTLHLRPLLKITSQELCAYVKAHNLSWVEDSSNKELSFDRNYLRHQIMPLLKQRWPTTVNNITRSAAHCGHAIELLEHLAQQDLLLSQGTQANTVSVSALLALSSARRSNVLRYWFLQCGERMPSTQQLQQLEHDVLRASAEAMPIFSLELHQLRRYRDDLYLVQPTKPIDANFELPWDGRSILTLPDDLGELHPLPARFDQLTVRFRRGGETIKLANRSSTQSLKKLFQQWHVPPWQRDRIPLLFEKERLIAVIGYCAIYD